MNAEIKQTAKRPRRLVKFLKIFLGVLFFLIIAGVISSWMWTRSGSSEWETVRNQDGVVIQTLKTPGSFVIKSKATKHMKTTLGALVSAMQDVDDMCAEGCAEGKVVKRIDSEDSQIVYTYSILTMPFPLKDREWVLENIFSQDSLTNEIIYKINAVPNLVPQREGFIRMTHFNNMWRFIPLGNGEVEVEWNIDMSYGGFFANLMHNFFITDIIPESFLEVEEIISREKHRNAKFDFIKEID